MHSTWKHNVATAALARAVFARRARNLETLVFVATTGRSGTKTLTALFEAVDGCVAFHEPYPSMNGSRLLGRSLEYDSYSRFVYRNIKRINIRRALKGARCYVETNHMFIKSFCDYAIEDFGTRVKVIHLYRNPVEVANSILSLDYVPGTSDGSAWYLDYRWRNNLIQIASTLDGDPSFSHDFYKCLWYWYEIEARTRHWRTRFEHISFLDFRTEDLDDSAQFNTLLEKLGLNRRAGVGALPHPSGRTNVATHVKHRSSLSAGEAHDRHEQFRGLLQTLGYSDAVVSTRVAASSSS